MYNARSPRNKRETQGQSSDRLRRRRENPVGMLLVIEFTEEFTMGNINPLSAGSISNGYLQNAAVKNKFRSSQSNESPIRDADMAAEISRLIKSQILYQANAAICAQASALNTSALSLMRDSG